MRVEMVDCTEDAERKIASYSAICYGSKTDEESNKRRINHLMDVKHLATLRFAYATFKVEGVSRACTHQMVRHPHLSYLQESQRYVKQDNTGFVIPPDYDDHVADIINRSNNILLAVYQTLLDAGVKKQDARYVLPEATQSSMYITGNLQAWYDFLRNRLAPHAQWEIRSVAKEIHKNLLTIAPNVFKGVEYEVNK